MPVCVFFFLRIRRPPSSTRTDTLFPYTTLFRSRSAIVLHGRDRLNGQAGKDVREKLPLHLGLGIPRDNLAEADGAGRHIGEYPCLAAKVGDGLPRLHRLARERSGERRVGKECVSTCRSRWSPLH